MGSGGALGEARDAGRNAVRREREDGACSKCAPAGTLRGTMKNLLFAIALSIFAVSAFAQGKVDFQTSDTIKTVLERQVGQKVELRIEGGEKIVGKVEKVGDKAVHLSSIAGQEFFDAVVALEEVSAVLIRTK